MKYLYKVLLGVMLLSTINAFSQKSIQSQPYVEKDSSYNTAFEKLKKLFIAKIHTQGYQENKKLIAAFRDKLRENNGIFPSGIGLQPNVLAWVKINLEKTKFKSYEEAVADYDAILKASEAEDIKHPDFSNYSVIAVMTYGPQILVDVVLEVMTEYPDKF